MNKKSKEQWEKDKPKLQKALYDAMIKTFATMSIEEIKQIDWFCGSNYERIGTTVGE